MATRLWTTEKLVDDAEQNLYAAREARQFGPANQAVGIIARLIGNLEPAEREEIPRIKTVIYNLSAERAVNGDKTGIVDAQTYAVLPDGDDDSDPE